MSDTANTDTVHISRGQRWASRGGAVWTVDKRRARANGFIEVLLTTAAGASRWVMESDVRSDYTLIDGS